MCSEVQAHLHPAIIIILMTAQLILKGLNVFSNLFNFMKYNEISILALNVGVLSLFLETFVFLKLLLKNSV